MRSLHQHPLMGNNKAEGSASRSKWRWWVGSAILIPAHGLAAGTSNVLVAGTSIVLVESAAMGAEDCERSACSGGGMDWNLVLFKTLRHQTAMKGGFVTSLVERSLLDRWRQLTAARGVD